VDINVNHPIKLTRIALRELGGKRKKGVVVITGSVAGLRGEYAVPLYCATKHAITGFVRSMKDAEQINGVKVVAVAPG
jgi:NAD(P)-dependent dehydrogenase (short-subunit alcohol dehydrogenase family)